MRKSSLPTRRTLSCAILVVVSLLFVGCGGTSSPSIRERTLYEDNAWRLFAAEAVGMRTCALWGKTQDSKHLLQLLITSTDTKLEFFPLPATYASSQGRTEIDIDFGAKFEKRLQFVKTSSTHGDLLTSLLSQDELEELLVALGSHEGEFVIRFSESVEWKLTPLEDRKTAIQVAWCDRTHVKEDALFR